MTRARQVPGELPLRCGADLLGHVVVTGADNYWWLGSFVPGPDFEKYRRFFERERELSQQDHNGSDEEYGAASDAWREALEEINRLGLRVGEPGEPIRDFKIDERSQVEFKMEWST